MEDVTGYLLSITAAAIVCGVIRFLIGKDRPGGKIVHMICGVFMAVTVLSPVMDFRMEDLVAHVESYIQDGNIYVQEGVRKSETEMSQIIKQQLEAYILDEALRLSLDVTAEVTLQDDSSFLPERVYLTGDASPYGKQSLSAYMETTLGIARENQVWT